MDMGITSPYFPEESTVGQPQMDEHQDDPEIGQETLDINTFYVQTLAGARSPQHRRSAGFARRRTFCCGQCSGCHIPTLQTGHHEIAALSNQTIHPYTDLLLHDMGEELADDRPDFEADGREWRTPPLWGIGLTATVNGIPAYLHDGRGAHTDGSHHVPRRRGRNSAGVCASTRPERPGRARGLFAVAVIAAYKRNDVTS